MQPFYLSAHLVYHVRPSPNLVFRLLMLMYPVLMDLAEILFICFLV